MASRPVGEGLRLHGHGVRVRMVLGQFDGDAPSVLAVPVRRYRCVECGAVTVVGPLGLVPRHVYGVPTMLVALWLWSQGATPWSVRDQVRPWKHSGLGCARRWASLRRWTHGWARRLGLRRLETWSLRDRARRCVQLALGIGPSEVLAPAEVVARAARLR